VDLFLQRCFDGLFNGAIYASLALALVMLFRATGLLNFALGEIGMVGGYTSLVMLTPAAVAGSGGAFRFPVAGTSLASRLPGHPYPVLVAIAVGVVASALLGVLLQRIVLYRLRNRSDFVKVNATIALLLAGLVTELWGGASQRYPSVFPDAPTDYVNVFGGRLRYTTLGAWAVQLFLLLLLGILVNRTKTGLAFRAITSNAEAASLMGIPVQRTLAIGWAVSCGIGALAVSLVAASTILRPGMMVTVLILAFAAATIGGLDSPKGAVVGGVIVGLTQSLVPGYTPFPSELAVVPPFLVMTILLMFRPTGLFGTARVVRV
jgi:branched-chain amino acid transport system permease protein